MSNDRIRHDPFADVLPFVLTAESKSFRSAARLLAVTPSAVSRAVARLETAVGMQLLARTSRSVRTTTEGELFLDRSREAVHLMETARSLIASSHGEPTGLLRVSIPLGLGRAMLLPRIPEFLAAYPRLELQVSITDRWVALVEENVDVAVRVGELRDSSLVARVVGRSHFMTIASSGYLSVFGKPRRLSDLENHRCLKFLPPSGIARGWSFDSRRGSRTIDVASYVTADHGESLIELCEAGVGIAHVPDYLAQRALRAGTVEQLFPGRGGSAGDISCVRVGTRHTSAKTRVFVEFVAAALARGER